MKKVIRNMFVMIDMDKQWKFNMIEKKGLSQIVATVLIILITVSAASFIAGFLVPFVKNNLDSTECFNYRDYFTFDNEFGYNCYESRAENYYKISVSAKTDNSDLEEGITGLGLAFINDDDSEVFLIEEGTPPSGVRMLSDYNALLSLPKSGELRSYNYSSDKIFNSAKIYSILKSGRECEVSDTIEIGVCD